TGLIMVSYPHRARLKLYADARIVNIDEAPDLFAQLDPADYPHRPERMIVLDIRAYDWNCPQHITPRYTMEEIRGAFEPQKEYIQRLEEEVQALREKLASLTH
ncbi:MAG TPA: pyridoxamine 5'-phosphate oxidase, partial [Puia sp.]